MKLVVGDFQGGHGKAYLQSGSVRAVQKRLGSGVPDSHPIDQTEFNNLASHSCVFVSQISDTKYCIATCRSIFRNTKMKFYGHLYVCMSKCLEW